MKNWSTILGTTLINEIFKLSWQSQKKAGGGVDNKNWRKNRQAKLGVIFTIHIYDEGLFYPQCTKNSYNTMIKIKAATQFF